MTTARSQKRWSQAELDLLAKIYPDHSNAYVKRGDYGAATSRGKSSVENHGIAVARGNGCRVKGGIGSILVVAEEDTDSYTIRDWKAVMVDGVKIKADTWYRLKDGKLIEDSNN